MELGLLTRHSSHQQTIRSRFVHKPTAKEASSRSMASCLAHSHLAFCYHWPSKMDDGDNRHGDRQHKAQQLVCILQAAPSGSSSRGSAAADSLDGCRSMGCYQSTVRARVGAHRKLLDDLAGAESPFGPEATSCEEVGIVRTRGSERTQCQRRVVVACRLVLARFLTGAPHEVCVSEIRSFCWLDDL